MQKNIWLLSKSQALFWVKAFLVFIYYINEKITYVTYQVNENVPVQTSDKIVALTKENKQTSCPR